MAKPSYDCWWRYCHGQDCGAAIEPTKVGDLEEMVLCTECADKLVIVSAKRLTNDAS